MSAKIVIVGNGSFSGDEADKIDSCDLVIRFNGCRSAGEGGIRTDVVAVSNTGRPAATMIRHNAWRNHPAVKNAAEIWGVRDALKFAELKPIIAIQYPELDDFCDDHTEEFASFSADGGKSFAVIPGRYHDLLDLELRALMPGGYVVTSSGLLAVAYVIGEVAVPGDKVLLAGFSHQDGTGNRLPPSRRL
ncbi:Urease operon accessory protein [Rhizobium sp. BK456]|uniref:Urease operon accessory protein n=1 Tax=Rhizobium sp. BK456 TaxID=2587007 RepID=UPI00161B0D35|nr:Urease operon accessory protein [Rhizobium sp. BK456]MBB3527229.1 hypothetical protein [Rhizobium sp. BK456]